MAVRPGPLVPAEQAPGQDEGDFPSAFSGCQVDVRLVRKHAQTPFPATLGAITAGSPFVCSLLTLFP